MCQFPVYSTVIQLYRYTCICMFVYIYIFRFFSIIGYYKILGRVPFAIQRSLWLMSFTYSSMYMLIPDSSSFLNK